MRVSRAIPVLSLSHPPFFPVKSTLFKANQASSTLINPPPFLSIVGAVRTRIDGVMDGCRYSNSVIARAATDFYLNGIPAGVVSRSLGVNKGTLLGAFARVAEALEPVRAKACSIISSAEFAQGDESRWRIDGRNGYAWVFMAGNLVVFACADSRAHGWRSLEGCSPWGR